MFDEEAAWRSYRFNDVKQTVKDNWKASWSPWWLRQVGKRPLQAQIADDAANLITKENFKLVRHKSPIPSLPWSQVRSTALHLLACDAPRFPFSSFQHGGLSLSQVRSCVSICSLPTDLLSASLLFALQLFLSQYLPVLFRGFHFISPWEDFFQDK